MSQPAEISRFSVNFPAGIMQTDDFLSYDSIVKETKYEEEHQKLKEDVKMLMAAVDKPWTSKMDLIDTVQHLGISYHFEEKIDDILQELQALHFDSNDQTLYSTSLRFRLLRQHGYKISSNIFNEFKDEEGNFKESLTSDVRGMLSLYEATHLRIHGEDILEEALAFTTKNLEKILSENLLSPHLSTQISHALILPACKNLPRLEAKFFMSVYGQDPSHNETLLRFAKLDFNILQKLHQEELWNMSRWWKDLDISKKLPFARDRIAECYFWMLGFCFEPEYVLDRKIFTKIVALTSMVDDIYDAYGTIEELELLTEAIERWDMSAANDLPDYLKVFYEQVFLRIYKEFEQDLEAEGKLHRMPYIQKAQKTLARAYLEESRWLHEKKIPKMEEFMEVGLITSTIPLLAVASLLAFENFENKDVLDWILSYPKLIEASTIVYRVIDDITTHEFEQERGHAATSVQCYVKQHGVTTKEAVDELYRQISDAWKDINDACLRPFDVPFPVIRRLFDVARVANVMYKDGDGYTFSQLLLKDEFASLLVHPMPL